MGTDTSIPTVAIIGGGFTGAAAALHLAGITHGATAPRIVIYEPRARLGHGLAYDTDEPVNRINVPAGKMSLYQDDPDSFLRFVEAQDAQDADLLDPAGQPFPQRGLFGAYVAAELAPHLASGRVVHEAAAVTSIRRVPEGWLVTDDTDRTLRADAVVIATSHPAPGLPAVLRPLADDPRLIPASAGTAALSTIATDARVLVVGNGLTAADAIATLNRLGHRGQILAISRRGLRSKGHAASVQEPLGSFLPLKSTRARDLVREIRAEVARAAAQGIGWQPVFDQLRAEAQQIWRHLPLAERQRIVRHLRVFWDVHRFRIAPQVEAVLDAAIAQGRLKIRAAGLVAATAERDGLHITLRQRGRDATPVTETFDAVIVATGPAHGSILGSQAYLAGLRDAGALTPCDTGLGIACDRQSRAIGRDGQADPSLLIAGPLARGTFGELMGLPQVADHALFIAQELDAFLRDRDPQTSAA